MSAIAQVRAAMYDHGRATGEGSGAAETVRVELRKDCTLFATVGADAELYLVLDPLTERKGASELAARLGAWLRAQHDCWFF